MHKLATPIVLRSLTLRSRVIYAPLAGCSDFAFRLMSARHSPPALMFCEMVKIEPLLKGDPKTLNYLKYAEEMRPIGAQLCGSNLSLVAKAAQALERLGFDIIDFNFGCPVDKVTKDGSGSASLKDPDKIEQIATALAAAVSIPVTLKIRAGWDEQSIVAPEIARRARNSGISALTIHGRTREQAYRGLANREWIRECKAAANGLPVIGNGDIFSPEDAFSMVEETDCDGVMVARGTMGNPGIARAILDASSGKEPEERSFGACKSALLEHMELIKEHADERHKVFDLRRVCCWYFSHVEGVRAFRHAMMQETSLEAMERLIRDFSG